MCFTCGYCNRLENRGQTGLEAEELWCLLVRRGGNYVATQRGSCAGGIGGPRQRAKR
jgi:hypothetical protein